MLNEKWGHLPHLDSLIGSKPLKDWHLLKRLSEEDIQIVNNALGIMRQKMRVSSKPEKKLRGDVRDPAKFVGLLGELFWCHRLTQLDYNFDTESIIGGPDFRIDLDKRPIYADVKTLMKGLGSNEKNELYSRLMKTINKEIKGYPGIFLIRVLIRRNFSTKTIRPLAAKIRECLQEMNHSKKTVTFIYPASADGVHNRQAEVTISQDVGKKMNIWITQPAILPNNNELLVRALGKARKQFNKDNVNIVFVDKTFRSTLEGEDIQDALYGKSVCEVSFDEHSGEPNNVVPFRRNNGFYQKNSRISAVIVYQRNGMSDIQDSVVYPHPESKLTKTEMEVLETLSGC